MLFFSMKSFPRFPTLLYFRHRASKIDTNIARYSKQSFGDSRVLKSNTLKYGLIGACLGATLGTALPFLELNSGKQNNVVVDIQEVRVVNLPSVKIASKVVNPNDKSNLDLILFQYQTCPFCCKVRAFLDFQCLSYSIVEVDAVLRQDLKWSEYRKVPIVLIKRKDGKFVQLVDSTAIISTLATYLLDPSQDIEKVASFYRQVSLRGENGKEEMDIVNKYHLTYGENFPTNIRLEHIQDEKKWRMWADQHLVHLISPNVYRTFDESLETFRWFSDAGEWKVHFPAWECTLMIYVGAIAMWLISKNLTRKYCSSDNPRSKIFEALKKITSELKVRESKYLGGSSPNLADVSLYGILLSMEGCSAFKDCLQNTDIGDWFYNMKKIIKKF